MVVRILIAAVLVLAIFFVTDSNFRHNVTGLFSGDDGGTKAPDIAQPAWPAVVAGGYYAVQDAPAWHDTRAKYQWVTAKFYANQPPAKRGPGYMTYVVTAYGPTNSIPDALLGTKEPVTQVGDGSCYDSDERSRRCLATNGTVVVEVGYTKLPGIQRTDQQLVQTAHVFADALTQNH
jgi:hypothetical protein